MPLTIMRSLTFDPVEAIDETFVCENDLKPVFVQSATHRAVLGVAVCAVPETDLGCTMKTNCFVAVRSQCRNSNLQPVSDSYLAEWSLT